MCRSQRCELKIHLCFSMRITGQILKAVYLCGSYCTTEAFMHVPRQVLFKRGSQLSLLICIFREALQLNLKLCTLALCFCFFVFNKRSSKSYRGSKSCFRTAFLHTFLLHLLLRWWLGVFLLLISLPTVLQNQFYFHYQKMQLTPHFLKY